MIVHRITSWAELVDQQLPYRMYRGQSNADWDLSSSLERACKGNDNTLRHAAEREARLLLSFKRHYHEFSGNIPESDDDLRWFAIMQHHGAPTRLTDWSYSLLVATYFAVEDAKADSAVWAIDTNWLSSSSYRSLKEYGIQHETLDDLSLAVHLGKVSPEDAKTRFNNWFLSNKYLFVKMTPPYVKDRRLTAQQGQFMSPGNVCVPFMDNLYAMDGASKMITKYIIPVSLRPTILYHLYAANVGRMTLFPDLDGFSASLRVFDPTIWAFPGSKGATAAPKRKK